MTHPPAPDVERRMRQAHERACRTLGYTAAPPDPDHPGVDDHAQGAWGWQGRTLGRAVIRRHRPAERRWMRVTAARRGFAGDMFWNGSLHAQTRLSSAIPRPRLRQITDWADDTWDYRAELYDHTPSPPLSESSILTGPLAPPRQWWTDLTAALRNLATTPTDRFTTDTAYIVDTARKHAGVEPDTARITWTTAHGDLHWANLCGPQLHLLDWEGWGLAPAGYDLAILGAHSLLTPSVADAVHRLLTAELPDPPAVLLAETVALAELLDAYTRCFALTPHQQQHADALRHRLQQIRARSGC